MSEARQGPKTTFAIWLGARQCKYQLVRSRTARKLRIRIGRSGLEVVLPEGRDPEEAAAFLLKNGAWVRAQLARVQRLASVYKTPHEPGGHVYLGGQPIPVKIVRHDRHPASNRVVRSPEGLVVFCDRRTAPALSLERWLRRQARREIARLIDGLSSRFGRSPRRVYIMDQRTKWANCSSSANLSFSWRLVMTPAFALRYIVTHELVHLAIPDHSPRFWLTVKGLCPDEWRARAWLRANERLLREGLESVAEAP